MKKLFLILIPFLFLSCEVGYFTGIYEYEFKNDSSITVTLDINNNGTYTLRPNESVNVKKDHNDDFSFQNNPRVKTRQECQKPHTYYYIYIENMDFYNYVFFNPTAYDVTVYEQNGMLGDSYGSSLNLKAGEVKTAKVYTTEPDFVAIYDITKMSALDALSISIAPN